MMVFFWPLTSSGRTHFSHGQEVISSAKPSTS